MKDPRPDGKWGAPERVVETEEREQDSRRRDSTAGERDASADRRDESSALRDSLAEGHDRAATDLDVKDDVADRHTLRVEELRGRGRASRARAADDRARAARDRAQATGDRAHAGGDRAGAEGDREHSADDRDHAADDRERAATDELTGARRRGVGLEDLANEMGRARRESDGRLVAAFIDVDGLKAVNDKDGHRAGDDLLRSVAQGLRRHMRTYDLLIRLGGDEFLCVLPNVTLAEARARFGRLRSDLAGSTSSVSIGYAELCDGDSPDDLVNRADGALLAQRGTSRRG